MYSIGSSLSVNEIISSAKLQLNDSDSHKFTPGWYISKAQRAMGELSLDTQFFEITEDVAFHEDTLSLPVPDNCFNLREVYLMNVDGNNAIREIHNVYWKRQYLTNGENKGYSATRTAAHGSDEYSEDIFTPRQIPFGYNLYYYSTSNGVVQFSSNCTGFNRVRMVFNGIHTALGDAPLIPQMFQTVVEDYIVEQGMRVLKAEDAKKWRPLWSDVFNILYDARNGTWIQATRRAKKLDHKSRKDFFMYQQKMNS